MTQTIYPPKRVSQNSDRLAVRAIEAKMRDFSKFVANKTKLIQSINHSLSQL